MSRAFLGDAIVVDHGDSIEVRLSEAYIADWQLGWPCATVPQTKFWARFDSTGLVELSEDFPEDVDGHELSAMLADAIFEATDSLSSLRDNTAYFVACGQFY